MQVYLEDLTFAKNLHSLWGRFPYKSSPHFVVTKRLCKVLTEEYLLPVEYVGCEVDQDWLLDGAVEVFQIPKDLSDIKIGWIAECLKLHLPLRTVIKFRVEN